MNSSEKTGIAPTISIANRQPRFLLVDEEGIISVYVQLIKQCYWNGNTTTVSNGSDALKVVETNKENPFDVIICGNTLGNSCPIIGIDVLRIARQQFPQAALFMFATAPSLEVRKELIELKATFRMNPVPIAEIRGLIAEALLKVK
ncbi:response regulator [bacterium]|nr:response regulator [bacterium]